MVFHKADIGQVRDQKCMLDIGLIQVPITKCKGNYSA
uniref:Uncharacterized protein n=1 Tax=Rhizophora mucronata TaxID=61149 RepID=A0A2P2NGA2_RHIMU